MPIPHRPNKTPETLRTLIRGELSAMETYSQALEKLGTGQDASELRRIYEDHRKAYNALEQELVRLGNADVPRASGAWGAFARAVESSAKLLGETTALLALQRGEEFGIQEYRRALGQPGLAEDVRHLIREGLLPQTESHLPVLSRMIERR